MIGWVDGLNSFFDSNSMADLASQNLAWIRGSWEAGILMFGP